MEYQARIFPASPLSPHYLTAETHKLQWETIPLTGDELHDELHIAVKIAPISTEIEPRPDSQIYASIQVHHAAKDGLVARVVGGVRAALLMLERYI